MRWHLHRESWAAAVLLLAALAGAPARGQQVTLGKEAYLTPPKELADVLHALHTENFTLSNLSPDGRKFLVPKSDGPTTLKQMARPCVFLGEAAFDHTAHRARQLWLRSGVGYDLFFHADGRTVPVQVPTAAR